MSLPSDPIQKQKKLDHVVDLYSRLRMLVRMTKQAERQLMTELNNLGIDKAPGS